MPRNIELLSRVRSKIKAEPDSLDMSLWASYHGEPDFGSTDTAKVTCSTSACIAGWAVQLSGDKLLINDRNCDIEEDGSTTYIAYNSVAKNGRVCDISSRGRKLLGLTYEEADVLFLCGDDEALGYLDELIAGEDIVSENWDG